jgi:hypothetical protein
MELDEVIALINSDDGKELPLSLLEKGVPEVMGVYVWYGQGSKLPAYVGKATGKKGLRHRILSQHLNSNYLETRSERWTFEDEAQVAHGVTHNGRPAIEKSAFRKNLARKTGNPPGEKNIQFIVENFVLRLLPFPNSTPKEIGAMESRLIKHYQPVLNRSGVSKKP